MEDIDIPEALTRCGAICSPFNLADTSFFLSRETVIPSTVPGMALWRERLFAWMSRNAESPMTSFKIPIIRVVELGSQITICGRAQPLSVTCFVAPGHAVHLREQHAR